MNKNIVALKEAFIPAILVVVVPTTILGFLLSRSTNLYLLSLSIVLVILVDISANVINNYADWDIDIANKKRNNMHRFFSKKKLLSTYLIMLLIIVFAVLFSNANIYLCISILLFVLLGIFYSAFLKLKDIAVVNYAAIALAYGCLSAAIGFFTGSDSLASFFRWLPIIVFLVLVDFGYSITKDYSDILGDKAHDKRTLPVLKGISASLKIQAVIITVAYAFLVLEVVTGVLNPLFLVLFISYLIAIYTLVKINRTTEKSVHEKMHYYSQRNGFLVRIIIILVLVALDIL